MLVFLHGIASDVTTYPAGPAVAVTTLEGTSEVVDAILLLTAETFSRNPSPGAESKHPVHVQRMYVDRLPGRRLPGNFHSQFDLQHSATSVTAVVQKRGAKLARGGMAVIDN